MKKIILAVIMLYGLNGCAEVSNNTTKINLEDGKYKIKQIVINNDSINIPKSATFNIDGDRIYGNSGCNSYFASFSRGVDNITIGAAGATRMYCANEEDNKFENIYLRYLNGNFMVSGSSKEIKLDGKNIQIILSK